jgi:uncharacterized cupin superfamily protein
VRRRVGDAGGLTDFGVNLMTLPPGGWSSQRHWHSHEDEFVYVLEGEVTLIEDGGETVLRAGDCAAFPKGTGNGHHMINRSAAMAVYLEVGSRNPLDLTPCSDIDMKSANADVFMRMSLMAANKQDPLMIPCFPKKAPPVPALSVSLGDTNLQEH